MNIALYRLDGGGGHWAMTERGRRSLQRDATRLSIGRSSLSWTGGVLTAQLDEITAPLPTRVRGNIRLSPVTQTQARIPLAERGDHVWRPIAPRARVEVAFDAPDLRWSGDGYLDSNSGAEPLERAFCTWDWARAHSTTDIGLNYDVARRDGVHSRLSLRVDRSGGVHTVEPPPQTALPRTGWGLARNGWRDGEHSPVVQKTLEDTPFYARTALRGRFLGQPAAIMHESLSLDRLRTPVVRAMLPFRMPRLVG